MNLKDKEIIKRHVVVKMIEEKHRDIYQILLDGESIAFEWHDNAHTDYPEDLIWNREISDVFYSGIELGMEIAKREQLKEN